MKRILRFSVRIMELIAHSKMHLKLYNNMMRTKMGDLIIQNFSNSFFPQQMVS